MDDVETRKLLDASDHESDDNIVFEESKRNDDTSKQDVPSYQNALDALGFGKFHVFLLLVCGLANASDAVEILCISLLLPAVECDLELTSFDKGWLSAVIFIGMMFGSYIWGSLGDRYGRRNVLSIVLLINGLFGGLSGLAQSFWFFLFMRLISGIGVGGSIPLVWSYFAEFQPTQHRASQMCLLASFWMIGNVTTAALGWAIIPHYDIGYFSKTFTFNSWRIFIVCCSSFSISSALLLFLFPKSPIFLLKSHRVDEAMQVLTKVYSINNAGRIDYPVNVLNTYTSSSRHEVEFTKRSSAIELLKSFVNPIRKVFGANLRKNSIIFVIVNLSLAFGYYGLWLWFPEMFNRLARYSAAHNGSEISICKIPPAFIRNITNVESKINCDIPVEPSVFLDSFILSVSNLPGNIISFLFMDKIGRKYFLSGGLISSGVSVFFISFVSNRVKNLVISSLFGGLSVVSFNAMNIIVAEIYPTEVRSSAMGLFLLIARVGAILGNVAFGALIDYDCEVPISLVACLLVGSGLLAILLPNTTRIALT